MKITQHPSLLALNTFRVSARAGLLIEVENEEDVLSMPAFDDTRDLVLGGGSNVLFASDVPGTVFLNRIGGVEILEEDEQHALIEAGAGENWHELVTWSLRQGLSGLENLALIPGLAGAAPIQNIGAYGVELASLLESVTAWDWRAAAWVVLNNEQCAFGYRDSLFKSEQAGRYFITSIRLRLRKQFLAQLDYPGLKQELESSGVGKPGPADVAAAVIRLRQRKLPDPAVQGNAGSFFKNPIVTPDRLESLRSQFPSLPAWPTDQSRLKIPAAWLIEQCGLKGFQHQGSAVSERHALVLLNQNEASGLAIWELAQYVQKEVQKRFGIMLDPEPRIYLGPEKTLKPGQG